MTLPEPYYERDGITIFCADCRDILPLLGPVDLVLTDPPYNAGVDYGRLVNDSLPWSGYRKLMGDVLAELERLSNGPILIFSSVTAMFHLAAVSPPRWVCAWTKPLSLAHRVGGSPFLPHWEPCLIYGQVWGDGGRVPNYHLSDVWSCNPEAERNGHPCPKPIQLIRRLVRIIPGDTILDPFMGSGTTLRAAKDLGRRAVGIEIEEKYCEIAVKRLAQEVLL